MPFLYTGPLEAPRRREGAGKGRKALRVNRLEQRAVAAARHEHPGFLPGRGRERADWDFMHYLQNTLDFFLKSNGFNLDMLTLTIGI